MTKSILNTPRITAKTPPFGIISMAMARRIDDSDQCASIDAANYRFATAMRELEQQFEAKASELRRAFLDEVRAAHRELDGA